MINQIDAALFKNMILSAANKLSDNKDAVDALNVFPVPDGDTGTNMGLTFMNAAKEIDANTYSTVSDVASAVAKATLRGARGNSGVILSQIFRGISKGLKGLEAMTPKDLAAALRSGSDTAYSAVMKPTEGTILTVIRKSAQAAVEFDGEDFSEFFTAVINKGNKTLAKTTQMLPQLQQAGVVDAGGQGLMFVLQGFADALDGKKVVLKAMSGAKASADAPQSPQQSMKTEDIRYAYCTEFIINKYDAASSADSLRNAIESKGDCMLIIDEEEIVKVHIHTNNPGYVLEQAVKLGEMINIKIDNMKHQHSSLIGGAQTEEKPEQKPETNTQASSLPETELAIIAVAAGAGLAKTFTDLGVSGIIEGGQTMNPSTEDILAAANKTNAKNVIILPNNKNIILSAEQVQYLTDRKIFVVPSRSIPEGITAAMAFNPDASPEELFELMKEAVGTVKSGSVTFAVRDTSIDGMEIAKGNYLGLSGSKIISVGEGLEATAEELVGGIAGEDSEVISVYYGADVTEDEANSLAEKLEEAHPDADVLVYDGGQPVYYYIISVE